jgi:MFS family permease
LVGIAWQLPLFLFAIGIPVALVVAVSFDETKTTEMHSEESERWDYLRKLLDLVSQPRVASVLVLRAIPVFIYILYMTYVSILVVRNMNGSPGTAGALVAIGSLAYAVSASQIGRFDVAFERRSWPLAGALVLMGVGLAVLSFAPNVWIGVLCVVFLGLGFGVGLSLIRSVITEFTQTELRGGLVSLGESLGRLAATVAPVIAGLLIGVFKNSMEATRAVQVTIFAITVVASLVGLIALGVARKSPTVRGQNEPVTGD